MLQTTSFCTAANDLSANYVDFVHPKQVIYNAMSQKYYTNVTNMLQNVTCGNLSKKKM